MTLEVSIGLEVKQDGKLLRSRHLSVTDPRARTMLSEAIHSLMDLAAAAGQVEKLRDDLTACQLERDRLRAEIVEARARGRDPEMIWLDVPQPGDQS